MKTKIQIRPALDASIVGNNMSELEQFQNKTLRPILKMQHSLLIAAVRFYIEKKKNLFYKTQAEKQGDYIENQIIGDQNIFNELRGMILGQFTVEEYHFYCEHSSEVNKRIKGMMVKRIVSGIDELRPKVK